MAQVTMNGIEYKELLKEEIEREELLNLFIQAQQVKFTEELYSSYTISDFNELQYPEWLEETLLAAMEAQLRLKTDEELAIWFASGQFFYSVKRREFHNRDWYDGVNMLEYSTYLKERYETWQQQQETTRKEDEDNE